MSSGSIAANPLLDSQPDIPPWHMLTGWAFDPEKAKPILVALNIDDKFDPDAQGLVDSLLVTAEKYYYEDGGSDKAPQKIVNFSNAVVHAQSIRGGQYYIMLVVVDQKLSGSFTLHLDGARDSDGKKLDVLPENDPFRSELYKLLFGDLSDDLKSTFFWGSFQEIKQMEDWHYRGIAAKIDDLTELQ